MWLRAETDNRAFYPDEFGHFNLQEASLLFGAVLSVEGPYLPLTLLPSATMSSTAQASGGGASASYKSALPTHNYEYGSTYVLHPAVDDSDSSFRIVRIESKVDDMKKDVEAIKKAIQGF